MKQPVLLYWQDTLELVQCLFNNPSFQNAMEFSPYRLYDSATRLYWLYTEWMSGEDTWSMQVSFLCFDVLCHINVPKSQLPAGATLLGTVLSSDKTNISVLTGDRVAHLLLISLTNIKMDT